MFTPKNILITGGAGFIGANHIHFLLKHYHDIYIVNLDKLTYAANLKNLTQVENDPRYTFVQGDITDRKKIDELLRQYHIDTVIHFAAESHVDNSIKNPGAFVETNVLGTYTLLEAARQYWLIEKKYDAAQCRFHHISTDEVYGSLDKTDAAFTEKNAYLPSSPYSATKAGSDHLVRAYFHTYGLPVTTSNCSNNYGRYQHAEKLMPTVIRHLITRSPIPVYGDGTNIRDWLYVDDHCAAIDLIIRQGDVGEVYNVGGDNELDNLSLVRQLCQVFDEMTQHQSSESLIKFVKDRPGHDWRYAIDHSKITKVLDWQPKTDFKQGLRQAVEFFLGENVD